MSEQPAITQSHLIQRLTLTDNEIRSYHPNSKGSGLVLSESGSTYTVRSNKLLSIQVHWHGNATFEWMMSNSNFLRETRAAVLTHHCPGYPCASVFGLIRQNSLALLRTPDHNTFLLRCRVTLIGGVHHPADMFTCGPWKCRPGSFTSKHELTDHVLIITMPPFLASTRTCY